MPGFLPWKCKTWEIFLADKIIALLKEDPSMKQEVLAEKAKVLIASIKRTMKRTMKILLDTKIIVR